MMAGAIHGSLRCVDFFFSSRRRHTRWNCDWSSDVCSSDLGAVRETIALEFADEESVVQTRFATSALALLRAHVGESLDGAAADAETALAARSEERRVGKEWRARWAPEHCRQQRWRAGGRT